MYLGSQLTGLVFLWMDVSSHSVESYITITDSHQLLMRFTYSYGQMVIVAMTRLFAIQSTEKIIRQLKEEGL